MKSMACYVNVYNLDLKPDALLAFNKPSASMFNQAHQKVIIVGKVAL